MGNKSFTSGLDTILQATNENPPTATQQISSVKRGRPRTYSRLITTMSQKGVREGETRATFLIKEDALETLKAVSYWKRKQIKAVLNDALETYFSTLSPSEIRQAEQAYKEKSPT